MSHWKSKIARFNTVELDHFLGRENVEDKSTFPMIKIQPEDQKIPIVLSKRKFERLFNITYRSFLTFPSYQILQEIIENCPYLMSLDSLLNAKGKREMFYQKQQEKGAQADTFIKWIDPVMRYGLFAGTDIPEESFIGEYTGLIRKIDKRNPRLNAYCFHYPTKFWSLKYFVIDASLEGNICRFINHSDQPNMFPFWLEDRGVLHLIFIANRPIAMGDELTFDYGDDYWKYRKKII